MTHHDDMSPRCEAREGSVARAQEEVAQGELMDFSSETESVFGVYGLNCRTGDLKMEDGKVVHGPAGDLVRGLEACLGIYANNHDKVQ